MADTKRQESGTYVPCYFVGIQSSSVLLPILGLLVTGSTLRPQPPNIATTTFINSSTNPASAT